MGEPVTGAVIGAFASLVVGTILYAVRRASSQWDKTAQQEARLAGIEARLQGVEKTCERIERRLDATNPG